MEQFHETEGALNTLNFKKKRYHLFSLMNEMVRMGNAAGLLSALRHSANRVFRNQYSKGRLRLHKCGMGLFCFIYSAYPIYFTVGSSSLYTETETDENLY